MTKALIAIAIALLPGTAWAQWTTRVQPDGIGGYVIRSPGTLGAPTRIQPDGIGGYTARTPGALGPTRIQPDGIGGFTIREPLGSGF
jgi:hypothetical protein